MEFRRLLGQHKDKINEKLEQFLSKKYSLAEDGFVKFIYKSLKDTVMAGGKRLRPALVIETFKMLGGKVDDDTYKIAVSIELLHNYTLIHDDIMDEDFERRGRPNLNALLREESSFVGKSEIFKDAGNRHLASHGIMAGNILHGWAYEIVNLTDVDTEKKNKVLEVLAEANELVNMGQIMDVNFERESVINEQDYLVMVGLKTAAVFTACLRIGAILADASEEQVKILCDYGMTMAKAFQIQDDLMDLGTKKGREAGSDIREGKVTLLLLKAREEADPEQMMVLNTTVGNKNAGEEHIKRVIEVYDATGAITHGKKLALELINQGKNMLADGGIKSEFLDSFADFMLDRNI